MFGVVFYGVLVVIIFIMFLGVVGLEIMVGFLGFKGEVVCECIWYFIVIIFICFFLVFVFFID